MSGQVRSGSGQVCGFDYAPVYVPDGTLPYKYAHFYVPDGTLPGNMHLTGPEKRSTADQVPSFIVQSRASPWACLTAFLTALLERGIAAGSMRSAARLGAIATGSGKHR